MDTGDNSPPEQQEPFWGSTQATEVTPPTQPVSQTVSAPQGQIMGQIVQQPQTHFSATASNPAQSGYMGSSPSITSDYDMSEKKKGMNWGQFAIGFFAPIVIMILLSILSEFAYQVGGGGGGDIVESFFCLMPLLGIVAIVISFARGNKSLGYGLITAASIPLVLGGLFLMLLMMFGF